MGSSGPTRGRVRYRADQSTVQPLRRGHRLHILRNGLSQHFFLKSTLVLFFFFRNESGLASTFGGPSLRSEARRAIPQNVTRLRLVLTGRL